LFNEFNADETVKLRVGFNWTWCYFAAIEKGDKPLFIRQTEESNKIEL